MASSDLSKAQLNGRSWERLLHFAWLLLDMVQGWPWAGQLTSASSWFAVTLCLAQRTEEGPLRTAPSFQTLHSGGGMPLLNHVNPLLTKRKGFQGLSEIKDLGRLGLPIGKFTF